MPLELVVGQAHQPKGPRRHQPSGSGADDAVFASRRDGPWTGPGRVRPQIGGAQRRIDPGPMAAQPKAKPHADRENHAVGGRRPADPGHMNRSQQREVPCDQHTGADQTHCPGHGRGQIGPGSGGRPTRQPDHDGHGGQGLEHDDPQGGKADQAWHHHPVGFQFRQAEHEDAEPRHQADRQAGVGGCVAHKVKAAQTGRQQLLASQSEDVAARSVMHGQVGGQDRGADQDPGNRARRAAHEMRRQPQHQFTALGARHGLGLVGPHGSDRHPGGQKIEQADQADGGEGGGGDGLGGLARFLAIEGRRFEADEGGEGEHHRYGEAVDEHDARIERREGKGRPTLRYHDRRVEAAQDSDLADHQGAQDAG